MDEVLTILESTYYTLIPMMSMQILTTIIAFYNRHKFPQLKYFEYYPLAGFIQIAICLFSTAAIPEQTAKRIVVESISIYILIEFFLIYRIMFRILQLKKLRIILKGLQTFFLLYLIGMWLLTDAFYVHSQKVFLIQGIVILIPTTLYLYQTFNQHPTDNLASDPVFWVIIGTLFLFSCTTPLFLLDIYFSNITKYNTELYFINNVSYSIFFIMICKGYLCKPIIKLRRL